VRNNVDMLENASASSPGNGNDSTGGMRDIELPYSFT
jgi:hypothetical protein